MAPGKGGKTYILQRPDTAGRMSARKIVENFCPSNICGCETFDLSRLFNAVLKAVNGIFLSDFIQDFVTGIKSGLCDEDAPKATVLNWPTGIYHTSQSRFCDTC